MLKNFLNFISDIFCDEDGTREFNKAYVCPACELIFVNFKVEHTVVNCSIYFGFTAALAYSLASFMSGNSSQTCSWK